MIELCGVEKSYGRLPVLRGLTFEVRSREVFTLLGPNGAGKTTAIKILCGLLDADAGEARIDGAPAGVAAPRRLGVAPQETALYENLTVRENLAFFAAIHGVRRRDRDARLAALLDDVGLDRWATTLVSRLSGGWRRRVNLAVALVHRPAALVLDEPTAGLDIEARHAVWSLVSRLRESGVAILLTTHLLDEAERLSDRVGVLQGGALVAAGTVSELTSRLFAKQVAAAKSDDEAALRKRARELGWELRRHAGELRLSLPERLDFRELVRRLEGIPLSSLALRDVDLEQVYVELTGGCDRPNAAPREALPHRPAAS